MENFRQITNKIYIGERLNINEFTIYAVLRDQDLSLSMIQFNFSHTILRLLLNLADFQRQKMVW